VKIKSIGIRIALCILFTAGISFAADTYVPDPAHTNVGFTATHLVITKVIGKFKEFSATVVYDPQDISKSSLNGTIKTASITTDNDKRDKDLKGEGFFDVEKYPEITFQSTEVSQKANEIWVTGNLTIRSVTKEVSFPVTIAGPIKDPWGHTKLGIEATLTINRQDFEVSWNKSLDGGGVLVSDQVQISINSELVKQEAKN